MLFLSAAKIWHFSAIANANLKFRKDPTYPSVLFGGNGVGKTTVVRAIKILKVLVMGESIRELVDFFDFRDATPIYLKFTFHDDKDPDYISTYECAIDAQKRLISESIKEKRCKGKSLSGALFSDAGIINHVRHVYEIRKEIGKDAVVLCRKQQMSAYYQHRSPLFDSFCLGTIKHLEFDWLQILFKLRRFAEGIFFADYVPRQIPNELMPFFSSYLSVLKRNNNAPVIRHCGGPSLDYGNGCIVPLDRESSSIQECARIAWALTQIFVRYGHGCYQTIVIDDFCRDNPDISKAFFNILKQMPSVHGIVTTKNPAVLESYKNASIKLT